MQEQWGRLLLEQSTWAAHHRVEQLARRELDMRLPKAAELNVVMIEPRHRQSHIHSRFRHGAAT